MNTLEKQLIREEETFLSNGITIAGILFIPEHADTKLAALVLGHPCSGVKEQTASIYTQNFAEKGNRMGNFLIVPDYSHLY